MQDGAPDRRSVFWVKGVLDYLLGGLMLLLLLPLMLAIAVVIKLTIPGSVLISQPRQGRHGRIFHIYKFRTAAQGGVPCRFGRWLQQSDLDELPQLINVLLGQMSLVGPRPHPEEQNSYYSARVCNYSLRLQVKPGITGWAQVNGLRGVRETPQAMRRRLAYDLYYIDHYHLLLDLQVLLQTMAMLLRRLAPWRPALVR